MTISLSLSLSHTLSHSLSAGENSQALPPDELAKPGGSPGNEDHHWVPERGQDGRQSGTCGCPLLRWGWQDWGTSGHRYWPAGYTPGTLQYLAGSSSHCLPTCMQGHSKMDLLRVVSTLRQDRSGCVQTRDQYRFIHQVGLPCIHHTITPSHPHRHCTTLLRSWAHRKDSAL